MGRTDAWREACPEGSVTSMVVGSSPVFGTVLILVCLARWALELQDSSSLSAKCVHRCP